MGWIIKRPRPADDADKELSSASGPHRADTAAEQDIAAIVSALDESPNEPSLAGGADAPFVGAWEDSERLLRIARDAWLGEWERQAVVLAGRIAGACLRRELHDDPLASSRLVRSLIREALAALANPEHCEILAHPDDCAALRESLERIPGAHRIIPDAAVERGGCRVRTTRGGEVDLTLAAQLERIERELLG